MTSPIPSRRAVPPRADRRSFRVPRRFLASLLLPLLAACAGPPRFALEEVATSEARWTGVAVMPDGRIFTNFPRWSDDVPVSVAEVLPDGRTVPFPDARWNAWEPGRDPARHFVCVQAVHADEAGRLWILDPGNPRFEGVVPAAPKLLLATVGPGPGEGRIARTIPFGGDVARPNSYLNDLRIDAAREVAYITDSGDPGLVVVDLVTGAARRVLDGHPTTRSEGVTLEIGGRPWLGPDGRPPDVHADGLALSPDRAWLWYQALTGRTLYRVPTAALRDASLRPSEVAARIEVAGRSGASDAIAFGADGRLYLTSLEHDAIRWWRTDSPRTARGRPVVAVADPRISWPDSFAVDPEGRLVFTVARIHEGGAPTGPFAIYRVVPEEAARHRETPR